MKKTYIKPENIVVHLNVERMMCQSAEVTSTGAKKVSGSYSPSDIIIEGGTYGLAREVIKSQDAWEEW